MLVTSLAPRHSRHALKSIFGNSLLARTLSNATPPASCRSKSNASNNTMTAQTPPETPDYTSYTHADLLRRVTDLESQLRQLNAAHAHPKASPTPKKKPKKAPKPFDPSRYHTRLIALKFAYLGGSYNGFEHHANNTTPLPTIEEELWRALRKTKLIFPDFGGKSEDEVCWDGCEYSKCGRTDRGVSAFGQVIGIRVRSSQPKARDVVSGTNGSESIGEDGDSPMPNMSVGAETAPETNGAADDGAVEQAAWDPVKDELPYMQLLNRVLPTDIRILAWCPHPPLNFSARFNCKERGYRYLFTNPAYATAPGSGGEGWLDIDKMQQAARKLEGVHDFRNYCKIDPSKQISNFERRIFSASVSKVVPSREPQPKRKRAGTKEVEVPAARLSEPELYYFSIRGSAFLWHQVRHLVAILFLVGQGHEDPEIVDRLLDIRNCPGKPVYEMADDRPLVLWHCNFPADVQIARVERNIGRDDEHAGFADALDWVYVGDEAGGRDTAKRAVPGLDDGKFGRNGIMDELWSLWRTRKMDEVLAGSLMDHVAVQGGKVISRDAEPPNGDASDVRDVLERSDRVFDGSDRPRTVGKYVPVMQRERVESPDVVNMRYAARKGLNGRRGSSAAASGADVEMDE